MDLSGSDVTSRRPGGVSRVDASRTREEKHEIQWHLEKDVAGSALGTRAGGRDTMFRALAKDADVGVPLFRCLCRLCDAEDGQSTECGSSRWGRPFVSLRRALDNARKKSEPPSTGAHTAQALSNLFDFGSYCCRDDSVLRGLGRARSSVVTARANGEGDCASHAGRKRVVFLFTFSDDYLPVRPRKSWDT